MTFDFEKGRRTPRHHNLAGMRSSLEKAGVIFIPENGGEGPGVRLRKAEPKDEQ